MITRKCNYRCRGCNVWQEQGQEELKTEEIKKGLDILKDLGVVEVVFSGGNPLLREDAAEIIDYASRFFVTTVYDNGSMALEKIEALRNVDFVAISIDSLDKEKNDYIRGVEGAWDRSIETLETLHKEGINVSASPTISQMNIHEIVDITNYFTEKGINVWYCLYSYDRFANKNPMFSIGKENSEFLITDKKGMVELCDSLIEMKKKNKRILLTSKVLEAIKSLYLENKRVWNCRALKNFFILDQVGRVAGCHGVDYATSVFDLPTVWNSENFNRLRRIYNDCSQCAYLCYIFYSIHGSPFGNLLLAREQWKNAGLLLRNERTKDSESART